MWTADGRYLVFTSSEGFSNGIASAGRHHDDDRDCGRVPLRDQDRDPLNRDIDNEAQAMAAQAQAAAGRAGGAGAGAAGHGPDRLEQPGAPGAADSGAGRCHQRPRRVARRRRRSPSICHRRPPAVAAPARPAATAGLYIVNVDTNAVDARCRRQRRQTPARAGWPRRGGGRRGARGRGHACSRATAGRFISATGSALFSAPVGRRRAAAAAPAAGGRRWTRRTRRRTGRSRSRGGAGTERIGAAGDVHGERFQVDKKALRAQVFNEGWRIMKNRFYDAEMNGVNWAMHAHEVRAAARLPRQRGRAAHGHDDDDRRAQRLAHGRERRTVGRRARRRARRAIRDSISCSMPSGYYRVGHIYKAGPADHDYLKVREGDYIIALDDRDLKTTDNYWQRLTLPVHEQAALPAQRQAGEGGRVGSGDHAGRQLRRPAVSALGRGSPRDGGQAQQWRNRVPAHPRDGRAVAAPVPARSGRQSHEEGARSSISASTAAAASTRNCCRFSRAANTSTRSAATPACGSRGRRISTARWS